VDSDVLRALEDLRDRVVDMVQLSLAAPSVEAPAPATFAQDVASATADTMSGLESALEAAEPAEPGYVSPEGMAGPEALYVSPAGTEGLTDPGYESPQPTVSSAPEYAAPPGATPPGSAATAPESAFAVSAPEYASPEGFEASAPEYVAPALAEHDWPDYAGPEGVLPPTPDYAGPEGVLPPTPDYDRPESLPGQGRDPEIMNMLESIAGRLEGAKGQPQGRQPPRPQKVAWSHTWTPSEEGFSTGASPSQNVSNIAGAGGASSRRGFGSHGRGMGPRYLNPEGDSGPPR